MGMEFDLAREALLASGIADHDEISSYSHRLESIWQRALPQLKDTRDPVGMARRLFEWLWTEKPARYESHGRYRLSEVIDGQLGKRKRRVGNCLGLTVLYNCLLQNLNIRPKTLHLENAFDIGPHVLTVLPHRGGTIDIEHIFSDGFDYKGHLKRTDRTVWGDMELVADLYHSAANECFDRGAFTQALTQYNRSIQLNPEYEKAIVNRAILLDQMQETVFGGEVGDQN
ncbi:MAG: hypothetical protein JRJ60_01280 [Deltaproteobacteria bacterium]|nr:hypothetical protein [Deltaproteobacteria bacterium]